MEFRKPPLFEFFRSSNLSMLKAENLIFLFRILILLPFQLSRPCLLHPTPFLSNATGHINVAVDIVIKKHALPFFRLHMS